MTEHETLNRYLEEWAGDDVERQVVADTTRNIAESCCAIAEIIALGPLAGTLGAEHGSNFDGDVQKELDIRRIKLGPLEGDDIAEYLRGGIS